LLGTTISDIDWNTPSVSTTTTYYTDATDNGCTTLTRSAVIAKVVKCNDTVRVSLCNTDGNYDLFNAKLFYNDTNGTWIDTTGLLYNKSMIDVFSLNGTYLFTYYSTNNTQVLLTVYQFKRSGSSLDLPVLCENSFNIYTTLEPGSYDSGGVWYSKNPYMVLSDSMVNAASGTSIYYYKQNSNGVCRTDSTVVIVRVDSIKPEITCANNISREAILGRDYYEVQGSEINPIATDQCGIGELINDYNNDSTLNGQRFEIGSYIITWKAIDMAGNENTCTSELTIDKLAILNFFSPNNDGYNDLWNFEIGSDHPEAIVEVLNRWGQIVWKSDKGYFNKWNGIDMKGKKVPDGGYQYFIIENGKVISAGSVTILR
jgi:gliding motility-associated-like protein